MGLILVNVFLGIIIVISLVLLWFVWPPDSPWSPWWQVGTAQVREGLKFAKINKDDIVYDLGSGDGRIPIIATREFMARGVGIEIDYIRYLTAWLKVQLYNLGDKVTLKRGNFFDYNISDATVIFVYLVPGVLEKLKPKLLQELKKGTKIISYKYKFEPAKRLKFIRSDTKNQIHLYQIL